MKIRSIVMPTLTRLPGACLLLQDNLFESSRTLLQDADGIDGGTACVLPNHRFSDTNPPHHIDVHATTVKNEEMRPQ